MIEEYVENICCYAIITSIIMNIFPDEKFIKYIRMFSGFILIMLLISPITKVFDKDLNLDEVVQGFVSEHDDFDLEEEVIEYESVIGERIQDMNEYETVIEERIENINNE